VVIFGFKGAAGNEDVAAFDPLLLARAFPRRRDGGWRLNTVRFLRRYRAHHHAVQTWRLVLVACTAQVRGHHDALTVSFATRDATHRFLVRLLPPAAWRATSTGAASAPAPPAPAAR
jgi:hypothetical protein